MRTLIGAFALVVMLAQIAESATWYVRPATDGNGTDLNYGDEDGSSSANAFDGFADMSGLSSGDTVCLPGSDEPFFDRLNTATAGVTYAGCEDTPAILWSAQGLSGNRSFNSSRAAVDTADYAWVSDGASLYHKRIDVRAQMLWEDETWLQPVDIDAGGETGLTAGQWGMKDNGDSTYSIYYRASSAAHSPTANTIRCDDVTTSDNPSASRDLRIDVDHTTFRNLEVRGHRGRAVGILDASGVLLDEVAVTRSTIGVWISADTVATHDIELRNVSITGIEWTGAYIQGGAEGITNLTVSGTYSGASGTSYNGTGFTSGDGDGIGIGQSGGNITNLVLHTITANDNINAGVFLGTSEEMTVTNFSLLGAVMQRNGRRCFSEGDTTARAVGVVIVSGFLCEGSLGTSGAIAMRFAVPASARTVLVANGTFANNASPGRLSFIPHAHNNITLANLAFVDNPGATSGNYGDIKTLTNDLIGDEVFRNISFYSAPNEHKLFATLGVANTAYYYDTAGDWTAFVSATGATNAVLGTDPLLTNEYHPTSVSPLRRAGVVAGPCADARGRVCPPDRPNIGAYQSTSGDPAATRAVRN